MQVETLINFFVPFFRHFFPPSLAPKLRKLLVFFHLAGNEKLGYEHTFQPYIYSLRRGYGAKRPPPRLYINSDPTAFKGSLLTIVNENNQLYRNSRFIKHEEKLSFGEVPTS